VTDKGLDVWTPAGIERCKRVCVTSGSDDRGFYALRRTAGDMVDDIAGELVADMMLAHRPRSITRRHYTNAKWPRLHAALVGMRARLEKMFTARPEDYPVEGRPATVKKKKRKKPGRRRKRATTPT
jgi:hypothetical protein